MAEESRLEIQCRVLTELRDGHLVKVKAVVEVGFPDRILLLPNGQQCYIEFKSKNGKRSPKQISWGDRLNDAYHRYEVIDSYDDFCLLLEELLP